ncbi:MAG: hypothetical protein ACI9OJ_005645 [Myxococcota bacterium]|jgi:hypothetical protein
MNELNTELADKLIDYVLDLDAAEVREVLAAIEPGRTDRQTARRLANVYALRGAIRGSTAGLPGGAIALILGVVDTRSSLRLAAAAIAGTCEIAEPGFLDKPDWQQDVFTLLFRLENDPQAAKAKVATRSGARVMGRQLLSTRLPKLVKGQVGRILLSKVSKRGLTRLVPVAGAVIGAVWNYAEIQYEAKRAANLILGQSEDVDDASLLANLNDAFSSLARRARQRFGA